MPLLSLRLVPELQSLAGQLKQENIKLLAHRNSFPLAEVPLKDLWPFNGRFIIGISVLFEEKGQLAESKLFGVFAFVA